MNKDSLREIGKLLDVGAQTQLRYPGGDKAARDIRRLYFTEALTMNMLRNTCFRQVRAWAATNMVLQSASLSTPQTTLELAAMLRDPNGNRRCPFGADFEEQSCTGTRMDRGHRIPFWLALMEVHSDGCRYGVQSDQNLPYVFEKVVDILTTKRLVQQESSQGAPERLIEVSSDLARALMTNPVFRHKIATHDLLSYAMTDALQYFKTITTEQLQHGDMMAPSSLLPEAAADLIAKTFFAFVLKRHRTLPESFSAKIS